MSRVAGRIVLALVVAAVAVAAVATTSIWSQVNRPYKGYGSSEQFVEIPPGMPLNRIQERLIGSGVIRDALMFRIAVWRTGRGRQLQAGEYRFDRPMTPLEVVARLARGDVYLLRITFPEGLVIPEMARIFEAQGFGAADAFVAAAREHEPIAAIDNGARDLEGYLFPDTYAAPRATTAAKLVRVMVERFQKVFTPELAREAQARGLSVREAVTLASIIEKEAARPEERPLVSAVYHNRLRLGMGLQCDPTVIYALQRSGKYDGNLTKENLMFDSPYNTYRYPGLPPGPIAAPGRASLEAAVRPAEVKYLYFVSRNDGSHVFANSLEEHNANVRRYQQSGLRRSHTENGALLTSGWHISAAGQRSPHFSFSRSTSK